MPAPNSIYKLAQQKEQTHNPKAYEIAWINLVTLSPNTTITSNYLQLLSYLPSITILTTVLGENAFKMWSLEFQPISLL